MVTELSVVSASELVIVAGVVWIVCASQYPPVVDEFFALI